MMTRPRADLIFILLFVVFSVANLLAIALSPLSLSPDETHYWEWSRRLDWAYYSKGPLIAYLIAASRMLFGDTEFAVRFPAFLCFSLFSLIFYFFVRRLYEPTVALVSWLAMRSSLAFLQTGILMTTDAPAILFYLIAIIAAYFAFIEERPNYWFLFGLSLGFGMLAKYTVIILLPSLVLFLLLSSQGRKHLLSWRFILSAVVAFVVFSPVIIWNQKNNWVNFSHNVGHLVKESAFALNPKYILELLAAQAGLLGPILFVGLLLALGRAYRPYRTGDRTAGFFWLLTLPLLLVVVSISLTKRVYANWPLPAYVSGLLLLAHLFSKHLIADAKWVKRGIVLNMMLSIFSHLPLFGYTLGLPAKILPTKKLVGWKDLSAAVDKHLNILNSSVIISDDYEIASELAFYSKTRPEVFCAYLDNRRMNQYDIWGGWDKLKDSSALLVFQHREAAEKIRQRFASFSELEKSPAIEIFYGSEHLREFYFFFGENYDGSAPELPQRR